MNRKTFILSLFAFIPGFTWFLNLGERKGWWGYGYLFPQFPYRIVFLELNNGDKVEKLSYKVREAVRYHPINNCVFIKYDKDLSNKYENYYEMLVQKNPYAPTQQMESIGYMSWRA